MTKELFLSKKGAKSKLAACGLFCFLCLSYGIIAAQKNIWPYSTFKQAREYYNAIYKKNEKIKSVKADSDNYKYLDIHTLLNDANATIIDRSRMEPGLTLICMGKDAAAMVDAAGHVRQIWSIPFSAIWSQPPHITDPILDVMTFILDAEVFPNGDLLAVYHGDGDTPYGYGLIKMDKNSNIIWKLPLNIHHDVYIAHSGTIYTLSMQYLPNNIPQLQGIYNSPILKDTIEIISTDGKELDSIPVIDAFINTPYEQILYQHVKDSYARLGDYAHANSVMPLEEDIAAQFPMFKPGQILVSLRHLSAIAVIDPKTRKVIWASKGIWKEQHEASFLNNGHILLLDNLGFYDGSVGAGNKNQEKYNKTKQSSRLLEIDPVTGAIDWYFTGTASESFYTNYRGTVQKLPNGNYLATETAPGRKIMEITPDKKVVWRYTNNKHEVVPITNNMFKAARIPFDFFDQDFLDSMHIEH